eukprot:GFUD01028249.1.p1 GENE.GFUD01028249.1~~GFUD01028249.1.p1  ORF type:complete len:554 (-),score=127.64 GFUD01028249.1:124-1785(-)
MDPQWNGAPPSGSLTCMLCRGSVPCAKNETQHFRSHLQHHHGVFYHHEVILSVNVLSKDYLRRIVQEYERSGDKSELVGEEDSQDVVELEETTENASNSSVILPTRVKDIIEEAKVHNCRSCNAKFGKLGDLIEHVNEYTADDKREQENIEMNRQSLENERRRLIEEKRVIKQRKEIERKRLEGEKLKMQREIRIKRQEELSHTDEVANSEENMKMDVDKRNVMNEINARNRTEARKEGLSFESTEKVLLTNSLLNSSKTRATSLLKHCKSALLEILLWYFTWLGPFNLLLLIYVNILMCLFFEFFSEEAETKAMKKAFSMVAKMWSSYTSFWHGQTFVGMDNIPREGPAVIVWYHGPMPVDYLGLIAEVFNRDGRVINSVVDRCLSNVPGSGYIKKYFKCDAFSKVQCAGLLESGQLVGIAPGGSREALFDASYGVYWGKRVGFAKVALLTSTPIIPIFTENIREAYCTMSTARKLWSTLFEMTKLSIVPIYGGFPVKLTTHVGTPITPHKGETADMLKQRVKMAVQELVNANQKKGQTIKSALIERYETFV